MRRRALIARRAPASPSPARRSPSACGATCTWVAPVRVDPDSNTKPHHPSDLRLSWPAMTRATILFSAPDRPGLVARLSGFFFELGLNILEASNYTDLHG